MSLVLFALTNEFALIGGETRGTNANHEIVGENFHKVVKLSQDTIMGCSGRIRDCAILLKDFCDFSLGFGLQSKNLDVSYKEIAVILDNRFKELSIVSNRIFTVVICGNDGEKISGRSYSMIDGEQYSLPGITPIEVSIKSGVTTFCIGTEEYIAQHLKNYNLELYKAKPSTLLGYKNVMKNVIDKGCGVDPTINNIYDFQKIKRRK